MVRTKSDDDMRIKSSPDDNIPHTVRHLEERESIDLREGLLRGEDTTKKCNDKSVINRSKLDDVTYAVYHHPKSAKMEIWLGKELKALVKRTNLNLSKFVRERLKEHFKSQGIEVKLPDPPLVLLVKCPHCSQVMKTTTVLQVKCRYCGRSFKVFRKTGTSRIVKIVKGNMQLVHSMYYHYYGKKKRR